MSQNLVAPQTPIPADNSAGYLDARYGNERAEGREQSRDYHEGYTRGEAVNKLVGETLAPTNGGKK
jgi:hypothetical protein